MILLTFILGILVCHFVFTLNTESSKLKVFLFGKHNYEVYEMIEKKYKSTSQTKKAK